MTVINHLSLVRSLGYDGVPSAPEKLTKYVHELLDESFKREQLEVQRAF